ncbi:hypothetical protein LWI28_001821 [Acer negundo]|uniref:Uncharacterized protein n=1 Tax=Acer negundo TaxID=4023 RepID=A0AAD5P543_ACENE|nr:hypothetical protein LWI28_001821 [Acer negundo]
MSAVMSQGSNLVDLNGKGRKDHSDLHTCLWRNFPMRTTSNTESNLVIGVQKIKTQEEEDDDEPEPEPPP